MCTLRLFPLFLTDIFFKRTDRFSIYSDYYFQKITGNILNCSILNIYVCLYKDESKNHSNFLQLLSCPNLRHIIAFSATILCFLIVSGNKRMVIHVNLFICYYLTCSFVASVLIVVCVCVGGGLLVRCSWGDLASKNFLTKINVHFHGVEESSSYSGEIKPSSSDGSGFNAEILAKLSQSPQQNTWTNQPTLS